MTETGYLGEPAGPTESARPTGHAAVDEVLESLESLGDRPVTEHVAVFEQAHEQLRRALSGQPGRSERGDAGA